MGRPSIPAAAPALGILAGVVLAPRLAYLPLGAVFALLALALAVRAHPTPMLAGFAVGLLSAALQAPAAGSPGGLGGAIDPQRPAEVVGRITSHPVRRPEEIYFRLRTESLRQGGRVTVAAADVWIILPADAKPPELGAEIRVRGFLRRSPELANGLVARRAVAPPPAWRMRLKSALFCAVEAPPGPLLGLAGELRRGVESLLDRHEPGSPGLALVRALALGDRSRLPDPWLQGIRRSGLAHLLAVSGLHVGLVALVVALLVSPLPPRPRMLAAVAAIAAYLLLIGPRPSVLRASLMGALAAAALACDRPPQAANALACGVAILLLWEPPMAADVGFQLSAAATAGILLFAPRLTRRWRRLLPGPLCRPLAISVAAQAATMPWILPLTGGFHPLAPLLNLVAVPYLGLFLFATFFWLAVTALSGVVGNLLLPAIEALAAPFEAAASPAPSAALFRTLDLGSGPLPAWLALAALIWALGRPALLARGAIAALLLLQTGSEPPEGSGPGASEAPGQGVELVLLDVGQGDAILIRDGARAALVDGGGWRSGDLGGRVLVPVLAAAGVHRLDAVVLTHPDVDHCAGLVDLARYLPVAELWMSPGWAHRPCAGSLLATPGKRWRPLWAGRRASLGRWRLTAIHPSPRPAGRRPADGPDGRHRGRNERSLVLLAEVFGRRVLLTGDIGAEAEDRLLAAWPDLRSDVLKVAHHGSKTSTTAAFLRAVAPRLALISAGPGNPYGHPAPLVIERLETAGARVLRTDRSGMIRVRFHPGGRLAIDLPGLP